jgi:hypothetical protein
MSSFEVESAMQLSWRTAGLCASKECVEVAQRDGVVMLRDSTQPHGTVLRYATQEWHAFVSEIQSGQRDNLLP